MIEQTDTQTLIDTITKLKDLCNEQKDKTPDFDTAYGEYQNKLSEVGNPDEIIRALNLVKLIEDQSSNVVFYLMLDELQHKLGEVLC